MYEEDLEDHATPVRMPVRAVEQCKIAADAGQGQGKKGGADKPKVREGFTGDERKRNQPTDDKRTDSASSKNGKSCCLF